MTIHRDRHHGLTLERVRPGYYLVKGTPYEIFKRYNFWIVKHRGTLKEVMRGFGLHNAAYRLAQHQELFNGGDHDADTD